MLSCTTQPYRLRVRPAVECGPLAQAWSPCRRCIVVRHEQVSLARIGCSSSTRSRRGSRVTASSNNGNVDPEKLLPDTSGRGTYLLMLINVIVFLLDKLLHVPGMEQLYLSHAHPIWWQWVTHQFCHASIDHISNNLFFLLTFGRLVEDTEGPIGLTMIYLLCGLGAALASYLASPHNIVSVGASGAVFGLFAVSVLTRLSSFSLRRLLESLVLGQFVVRQVMGELHSQAMGGLVVGGLQVSHLAHLGGALAGCVLVLLLHRLPKVEAVKGEIE